MRCPYCDLNNDRVVDSRESKEGTVIRRRRECLDCQRRFTSYERIDQVPLRVVKKDERREDFVPQKLYSGLKKACEKRPIPPLALEQIVKDLEKELQELPDKEISTVAIGEFVMKRLKNLDKVAFIRFASVYREFEDVTEFLTELEGLLKDKKGK